MSAFSANTYRTEGIESGKYITIISNTDDRFEVPVEYIGCSKFIIDLLDMCENDHNPEIPLLSISTPTLVVVTEFMKEYTLEPFENLPKPLPENGIADCVRPYFRDLCLNLEFVTNNLKKQSKSRVEDEDEDDSSIESVPKTSIIELLQASSFLRIDSLKELCSAYLAQNLKKKNFMEVKSMFKCSDLVFDYKKMDKIYKDHEWCFQKQSDTSSSGGGCP
jgi:hypothetical protein